MVGFCLVLIGLCVSTPAPVIFFFVSPTHPSPQHIHSHPSIHPHTHAHTSTHTVPASGAAGRAQQRPLLPPLRLGAFFFLALSIFLESPFVHVISSLCLSFASSPVTHAPTHHANNPNTHTRPSHQRKQLGTYLAQLAPTPIPASQAFSVTCVAQVCFILTNPLWGLMGDRFGGKCVCM
jgi:hypothetical protein